MFKTIAFLTAFTVTAAPPSQDPPPITLTHDQIMTIRAALEQMQIERDDARDLAVFWYKKAQDKCSSGKMI